MDDIEGYILSILSIGQYGENRDIWRHGDIINLFYP